MLDLVDVDALAAFIAQVAPTDGPLTVEVLSGGSSNLTYVARTGAHEYVARRRPRGQVAAGAHDMAREYRVLSALQGSGVPVPVVYGYSADEAVMGAPFYVMSRVAGVALHTREDVAVLSPPTCEQVSAAVVDELARLHDTDLEAVGLAGWGRPEGFVARRIDRWLAQWRRGEHRDLPLVETLSASLAASVPAQTDSTLVHGDYRLGNMLIDLETDPARIAALLDWELSTLGDPLTDLAHLLVFWEPTKGRVTHSSQLIAGQAGFAPGAVLAERYATARGQDLGALDFYLAFEHWRAAIIKEAIHTRRARGEHPDDGEDFGSSVLAHLDEAADLLTSWQAGSA